MLPESSTQKQNQSVMKAVKVTNRYNMSLSVSDISLLQVALETRLSQIDKMIKLFEGYNEGQLAYEKERRDVEQFQERVRQLMFQDVK